MLLVHAKGDVMLTEVLTRGVIRPDGDTLPVIGRVPVVAVMLVKLGFWPTMPLSAKDTLVPSL